MCKNGHPFCLKCVGLWSLTPSIPDEFSHLLGMFPSRVVELFSQIAAADTSNTCPVCRVVGPFMDDRETDDAQQVSNYTIMYSDHISQ